MRLRITIFLIILSSYYDIFGNLWVLRPPISASIFKGFCLCIFFIIKSIYYFENLYFQKISPRHIPGLNHVALSCQEEITDTRAFRNIFVACRHEALTITHHLDNFLLICSDKPLCGGNKTKKAMTLSHIWLICSMEMPYFLFRLEQPSFNSEPCLPWACAPCLGFSFSFPLNVLLKCNALFFIFLFELKHFCKVSG